MNYCKYYIYVLLKSIHKALWSNYHLCITLAAISKILSSLAESEVLEHGGGGGGAGFAVGVSKSPRTMFTRQYSISAMNTNTVQTDMKASTAFRYETGGKEAWLLACCVESVSNEVTPKVTRAGAASGFIQNDIHCNVFDKKYSCKEDRESIFLLLCYLTDMMTIKHVGT